MRAFVLAAAVLAFVPATSTASPIQITTRAALGAAASFNWNQLGSTFTVLSSPQTVVATNGLSATVSDAPGSMQRRDEGNGWIGNFAVGDALLWNQDSGTPITMTFANAISGFAFQIQGDFFGAFDASVDIFNGATLLGTFTVSGNNTGAEDNLAPLLGATDSIAEITRIVFTNTTNTPNAFAINQLDVRAVPEPATLTLVGLGLGGLLRRRRSREAA